MKTPHYHSTLERRLAIYVGLGTMIFSLLVGELAYLYFFSRGIDNAWALEQQLTQTVASQAAVGAFAQNDIIAQEVIQGLLINPLILGVRIESHEGFRSERTKKPGLDFTTATSHPLISPIKQTESIGSLRVILDLVAVKNTATTEAMNYAGLMVLQIMIAAVILMTLFRRLLGQPVADLAKRMVEIHPGDGSRLAIDKRRAHDEIGLLSRSANFLLDAADRAIYEEREIRQRLVETNQTLQREVEERRRAELALRETQRTLSTLIDNLSSMVYRCANDVDYTMFYVSEGCFDLTGYTADELLNNRVISYGKLIALEKKIPLFNEIQNALAQRKPYLLEYAIRTKSGTLKWVWEKGRGVYEDDHLLALEGIITDITQRKEMEDSLRAERDFVSNLIDTLPGIFYLFDQNGKFRLWNMRFEEITGLTAAAIATSTPTDYFRGEDQERIAHKIREAFIHGHTIVEADLIAKNGTTIPFYFESSRIDLHEQPHLIGLGVDISDRRYAEKALRIQEEQYRLISENMIDLICLLTPDSTFLYVSPSVEIMLGYTPQDLLGRRTTEFIHPEDLDNYFKMASPTIITNGRSGPMVYRLRTKGGDYIWVESLIKPILDFDENGIMVRLQIVSRDVTERERITVELQQARQAAEKASQVKGEFLATMSHEIRTPMNAIIGLTDLALRQEPPKKLESYLTKIRYASRSLLRIINDILDFSKIEAGKLILESVDFNLYDLLDNLGNMFRQIAADKGIELNLVIDSTTPGHLRGDPTRLEQILINLISNAIKFTPRGEIMVHVVPWEKTSTQIYLKVMVRDSGIGIEAEQIYNLFNPFSQADSSITRQYGGTGLGLSICKRLVGMMDGEIWVESIPKHGSTFHFTVTVATMDLTDSSGTSKITLPEELLGLHILIVDDNEAARLALRETLCCFQFPPTMVTSGKAALSQMRESIANDVPFDLILMDQRMPEMDGIETTRQLQNILTETLPKNQFPKIIMLTAFSNQELILAAKGVGIDILLQKPIDNATLFNAIMEVFNRENLMSSSAKRNYQTVSEEVSIQLGGARILLVEDNAINREVAREILTHVGIFVEEAYDGQEALRMIRLAHYDAVLMDIQMPVMDGITATHLIRQSSDFQALPIIAMTAHAMLDMQNEGLAAGMNDYVTKPIEQAELFAALVRWIKPQSAHKKAAILPEPVAKLEKRELSSPKSIHGIDLPAALARINHNHNILRSIFTEFRKNYAQSAAQLREFLDGGRKDDAKNLAHAIKGVAGNLSAHDLFNATLALESALKEDQQQEWPTLLNNFEDTLTVVLHSIEEIQKQEQEIPNTKNRVETDQIINLETTIHLLKRLADLLADDDGEAHAVFASIKPALLKYDHHGDLAKIETCIDRFDYKNALAALNQLQIPPHYPSINVANAAYTSQ